LLGVKYHMIQKKNDLSFLESPFNAKYLLLKFRANTLFF